MQRVMERPQQTVRRPVNRRRKNGGKNQVLLKDFLELCAEYDRRILEIGRLMHMTGSDKAKLERRIEVLKKQQQECVSRIRGVISCMMGWCY